MWGECYVCVEWMPRLCGVKLTLAWGMVPGVCLHAAAHDPLAKTLCARRITSGMLYHHLRLPPRCRVAGCKPPAQHSFLLSCANALLHFHTASSPLSNKGYNSLPSYLLPHVCAGESQAGTPGSAEHILAAPHLPASPHSSASALPSLHAPTELKAAIPGLALQVERIALPLQQALCNSACGASKACLTGVAGTAAGQGFVANAMGLVASNTGGAASDVAEAAINAGKAASNGAEAASKMAEAASSVGQAASNGAEAASNMGDAASSVGEAASSVGEAGQRDLIISAGDALRRSVSSEPVCFHLAT